MEPDARHFFEESRWNSFCGDTPRPMTRSPTSSANSPTRAASRQRAWPTGSTPRLSQDIRILVSPATRTLQTAQALGRDYQRVPALAPGASAEDVLAAAGWPDAPYPVLVVGHQPTLGQVAMQLLTGQAGDLAVKKGSIWWFQSRERAGQLQVVLRAVATPDWL